MCDTRGAFGGPELPYLLQSAVRLAEGTTPANHEYGGKEAQSYIRDASGRPITVLNPPYTPNDSSYSDRFTFVSDRKKVVVTHLSPHVWNAYRYMYIDTGARYPVVL